jgi:hypothetical protein
MLYINTEMEGKEGEEEVKNMKGRIFDKLCAIDDTGRASSLSAGATVFCGHCGAEAYDEGSVCEPVAIGARKK